MPDWDYLVDEDGYRYVKESGSDAWREESGSGGYQKRDTIAGGYGRVRRGPGYSALRAEHASGAISSHDGKPLYLPDTGPGGTGPGHGRSSAHAPTERAQDDSAVQKAEIEDLVRRVMATSNPARNVESPGRGSSRPIRRAVRSPIMGLINGLGTMAGAIGVAGSVLLAAQWGAEGYNGLNELSFWALVAFLGGLVFLIKFVGWVDDWEDDFTPIVGTFVVLYALAGVFFMITLANVIWNFT